MTALPVWLPDFANAVAAQLHSVDPLPPLGCHVHRSPDAWEVTLFASKTEVIGGKRDGLLQSARFHLDLAGLLGVFSEIHCFHWQAQSLGRHDDLGPHVAIEGEYRGETVWLRIPADAPAQFPPGRHSVNCERTWEEVW